MRFGLFATLLCSDSSLNPHAVFVLHAVVTTFGGKKKPGFLWRKSVLTVQKFGSSLISLPVGVDSEKKKKERENARARPW